jgi:hypothetical protein
MKAYQLVLIAAASMLSCSEQGSTDGKKEPGSTLTTNESRCALVPDPGPCKALFKRYYYDKTDAKCKEFIWGGCDGVVPFETLDECETCKSK